MVWCLTISFVGAYHRHNECVGQDQTQNARVWHRAKRTGVSAATHGVHAFTDPGPPSYLKRWPRSRLKGNLPIVFFNQSNIQSRSCNQSDSESINAEFQYAAVCSTFMTRDLSACHFAPALPNFSLLSPVPDPPPIGFGNTLLRSFCALRRRIGGLTVG